jgi:hypothetical protein
MPTNKPTNPFGHYSDCIQPKAVKKNKGKTELIFSVSISPQDSDEWKARVKHIDNVVKQIHEQVEKSGGMKFVKRRFLALALENEIAKFLAENPQIIIK